ILTQNIDAFHSMAGSRNVIEIHGNMYRMKCTGCSYARSYENYEGFEIPPSCPDCPSMVRPDVVLFEEQLPLDAVNELYTQLEKPFDLVISIGTSSHFPYIIEPVRMAFQRGIPTIEINPSTTSISPIVDVKLEMGAKDALEQLWPLEIAASS
ncbi:MAG: Sir2 family NAD-dependent protein deacetylase, partial [Planctomycetota bacterium]